MIGEIVCSLAQAIGPERDEPSSSTHASGVVVRQEPPSDSPADGSVTTTAAGPEDDFAPVLRSAPDIAQAEVLDLHVVVHAVV